MGKAQYYHKSPDHYKLNVKNLIIIRTDTKEVLTLPKGSAVYDNIIEAIDSGKLTPSTMESFLDALMKVPVSEHPKAFSDMFTITSNKALCQDQKH